MGRISVTESWLRSQSDRVTARVYSRMTGMHDRFANRLTFALALLAGALLATAAVVPGASAAAGAALLDSTGSGVSAYGGWAAWTHRGTGAGTGTGEYTLMVRSPSGAIAPASAPAGNGPFAVALGPSAGGVAAVYQRCAEPARSVGCAIYELVLTSPDASERRLAIPGGGSDFMPALWKGHVAFARANAGGGRRRPDALYTWSIGGGAPQAVRLPVSRGGRETSGEGRWPRGLTGAITGLALGPAQLAYVTSNVVGSSGESTLWYEPIGGRPELIDQAIGGAGNVCPPSFLSPVLAGTWLYAYLHACDPSANPALDRLTRYRRGMAQSARHTFARAGDDAIDSVVPDGAGVDYGDEGVLRVASVAWRSIALPVAESFCGRSDPFC